MKLNFNVRGQTLCPAGVPPKVASDSLGYVQLQCTFDGDWDGTTRVVQFTQLGKATLHQVLDQDGCCYLPNEIGSGRVEMMVFGQSADSAVRITTQPYGFNILPSGFVGDGETPVPPTADLYAQLLGQIDTAVTWVLEGSY